MLRFLSIRHLAVIETLEVEFGPGLNVLTGETGAGKSVLVEAIELLLGARAAADLVRTGADTAVVQAVMDTSRNEEVILRREVSSSGRSRAFIDGNLVTSSQLRDLTGPLIDLHGQHEHQALLAPHQHLSLLDVYAALDPARVEATAAAFEAYRRTRAALEACRLDERERVARLERLQFQLGQIEKVNPRPDEDEELAAERHRLANVDRLLQLATDGYQLLYEGDGSVLDRLSTVWKRVGELATLDPSAQPYLEARDPIRSQLEDLALYLRSYIGDLEASPDRLQFVEDRLAQLERLKRSYGPALGDVIGRRAALEAEVDALTGAEGRAATLGAEAEARRAAFLQHAEALSTARRTAAVTLQADLANVLGELAMPHAVLDVRFPPSPLPEGQWSARGVDTAEFFLSANPGEAPRPLARVASGGELSRIMLGLKSLATVDTPGKTLVFDEVDAGIGGRVADAVGKRLRALGTRFQVLCITHLPQVAAYGHSHYRVTKSVERSRALTKVERLDQPARVGELARMIGGERVTEAVLAGAAEMLAARGESKENTKDESESRRGRSRR